MNRYQFSVIIEKDEDGYYEFVPELKGCYTQGSSYEEIYEGILDAIRLCVEDQIASGEPVHQFEHIIPVLAGMPEMRVSNVPDVPE